MDQKENIRPTKIIKSGGWTVSEYLNEMWKYKNLIFVFALQEFKVQYVQTRLNFLWVVLKPLMTLTLFTFIFAGLIPIPGLKYPYPLFAFSGLLIWSNFSFMVNNAGGAILANQLIVKKIYFPKMILILSKTLIGMVEVSVSIILILLMAALWRYPLHWHILFLPVVIMAGLVPGIALAVWLNTLTIRYRDLFHLVPTMIGFLIWLTPVFYPITIVPERYSFILYLNPISGVIQACRWAILGDTFPSVLFLPSFLVSVFLLVSGCLFFIREEADLADYI